MIIKLLLGQLAQDIATDSLIMKELKKVNYRGSGFSREIRGFSRSHIVHFIFCMSLNKPNLRHYMRCMQFVAYPDLPILNADL